jgi:hypothetical protein
MKKKLALGIAGASAALIAGFRLVQELTDRDEATMDPVAVAPGIPVEDAPVPPAKASLKSASKAELYETAQELGIEGRSKMTKAELIKAIEEAF